MFQFDEDDAQQQIADKARAIAQQQEHIAMLRAQVAAQEAEQAEEMQRMQSSQQRQQLQLPQHAAGVRAAPVDPDTRQHDMI